MNKNLAEIISIYSTKDHIAFSSGLLSLSKDGLAALFADLLTMYINDKNSSTIREFITVSMAGYKHNVKKIGFNGFRQDCADKPIYCEAKPKNILSQDFADCESGLRTTKPATLNGGGNFTDYTWARLEKDKKANLNMLISGFVDGKLIYILEFPFNSSGFTANLEQQLSNKFPDGDESGYYLRSAVFSFKDYISAENLKVVFLLKKEELKEVKKFINVKFYDFLLKKTDGRKC